MAKFAEALEEVLLEAFNSMPLLYQQRAYQNALSVQSFLIAHEFAHFLNRDFSRLRAGTISRKNAELDADVAAMMWLIEDGATLRDLPFISFATYLFEKAGLNVQSNHYESISCRSDTLSSISTVLGTGTRYTKKLLEGTMQQKGVESERFNRLQSFLKQLSRETNYRVPGNCDGADSKFLLEIRSDFISLASVIVEYRDVWGVEGDDGRGAYLPLKSPRIQSFISELLNAAKGTKRLRVLASQLLALSVLRLPASGGPHPIAELAEYIKDHGSVRAYLRYREHGLLKRINENKISKKDLITIRDQALEIVALNPFSENALVALSTIYLKLGDCERTLDSLDRAISYVDNQAAKVDLTSLRIRLRKGFQSNPENCL